MCQVTPGFENMFISHNTWWKFQATMRIFKHYHLNVKDPATAAYSLSFSSYPGSAFTRVISRLIKICVVRSKIYARDLLLYN